MERQPYRDLLRLSDTERKLVLDRLDGGGLSREGQSGGSPRGSEKRKQRRWAYRAERIGITVEHPGGGVARYLVSARNLSAGGLSFLHGGFLHPGARCRLNLLRLDGQDEPIDGTIASCRLVEGRIHEIGLKFDRLIDPTLYLRFDTSADQGPGEASMELPNLQGRVLYLDDSPMELKLLKHHLRATGIDLTVAATPAEALEAFKSRTFEIVMCDLNLEGGDSVETIRAFRSGGFTGPIVLLTADANSARIDTARQAGASHVLKKPYAPPALFDLMIRLHQEVGAIVEGGRIRSEFEGKQDMVELIEAYVEEAKNTSARLECALRENDLKQARELCLKLSGSASGYGFSSFGEAAAAAVAQLDASKSLPECAQALLRVCLMSRFLSARDDRRQAPAADTGHGAEKASDAAKTRRKAG
jgi:CheY-like chemotaxis protein